MLNPNELQLTYKNGKILNVDSTLFSLTSCLQDYVIEQYTGLKDKNGVEIYEGDIVKNDCCDKFTVEYGIQEIYAFETVGFNLTTFYDDFTGARISREHEVIGNIHEEAKE